MVSSRSSLAIPSFWVRANPSDEGNQEAVIGRRARLRAFPPVLFRFFPVKTGSVDSVSGVLDRESGVVDRESGIAGQIRAPHRTLCPVSGASSGGRPCPDLEPGGRSAQPPRGLPGAGAPIARSSLSQPRSSRSRGTDRCRSRRCAGRRATEARASPWASPRFARRPRRSRERSRNESGGFLPNGRKPPAFAAGARFSKHLI